MVVVDDATVVDVVEVVDVVVEELVVVVAGALPTWIFTTMFGSTSWPAGMFCDTTLPMFGSPADRVR